MKPILVYITNSSKEEAEKIAKHLLEKRLIACASIYPIQSMYWWEGEIANENEYVLDAKTSEDIFEEVKSEVEKIHTYSIPCILKIPIDTNDNYKDWMKKELN